MVVTGASGGISGASSRLFRMEGADLACAESNAAGIIRFGEFAGTAVFLASPAATLINGVTIPVDGGYLAT